MATDRRDGGAKEVQLALRVPRQLIAAIDAEVERLRQERPGARVNRSDAVREILFQALLSAPEFAVEAARRRDRVRQGPKK